MSIAMHTTIQVFYACVSVAGYFYFKDQTVLAPVLLVIAGFPLGFAGAALIENARH